MISIANIDFKKHVLIAGPTASGKSSLAMAISAEQGGTIVNADALQVYENWRVLTARPSQADEETVPHALYGHVPRDISYSVGHWLRDVSELLDNAKRIIVVGGTGLYFRALTEGLSDIPAIPQDIREEADQIRMANRLDALIADLDAQTKDAIDLNNPMRVQRAWEVQKATGKSLLAWHAETPPPLLPLSQTTPIVIDAPKDWLSPRIRQRFGIMIDGGALEEARGNLGTWEPDLPSSKAIGAPELMDYLAGRCSLEDATEAAIIATQQYAKRQRTWFRARMKSWNHLNGASL